MPHDINAIYVTYSRGTSTIIRTDPPEIMDRITIQGNWALIPAEFFNLETGRRVPVNVRYVD